MTSARRLQAASGWLIITRHPHTRFTRTATRRNRVEYNAPIQRRSISRHGNLLFGDLLFANSVAPSTYLGGEPLAAYLLTRHTGSDYETSFATVSSVDLLNYAPMLPLAGVGLVYFAVTATLGRPTELVLLAVLAVFGALVVSVFHGWRYRRQLVDGAAGVLGGISVRISAIVPGVRAVSPITLHRRFELFVDEVERVTEDQRNLRRALLYSTSGWLCLSLALWLAAYAVGYGIPPEAALFIVPLGAITNILPLPGGLGNVESVFILLLIATAGVPAVEATAVTLLYRAATYWLPLLFGAGSATVSHFARGDRRRRPNFRAREWPSSSCERAVRRGNESGGKVFEKLSRQSGGASPRRP
ncbi:MULTISPECIES: lysylphosphatidylglycerol synthase transmembrane domain-containing protein [Natrialbaceae]|uniref:lysylphosphatidylglycerol synthase transmembrane domain-containing protein n=1 Tax=Natrialbaceae TaxID=1644061 RepID=UPI00207C6622|nr:lysylphosphatidylglycerol synthase transmembrane domain-containing protein [Natronococcus sp. CG52]